MPCGATRSSSRTPTPLSPDPSLAPVDADRSAARRTRSEGEPRLPLRRQRPPDAGADTSRRTATPRGPPCRRTCCAAPPASATPWTSSTTPWAATWNGRGTRASSSVPEARPRGVALAWAESVSARPFFLFLHIYEPHFPHEPPEPFRTRHGATYDGEVAASDAVIGEFLGPFKRNGVYDRAIILLVSDHGEGLGDHGEQEHGILLYREALHVPLLLKLPGSRDGGTPRGGAGRPHRHRADGHGPPEAPGRAHEGSFPSRSCPRGEGRAPGRLQRNLLPPDPSRVESLALARERPPSLHRRAEAGALRDHSGPSRDRGHRLANRTSPSP